MTFNPFLAVLSRKDRSELVALLHQAKVPELDPSLIADMSRDQLMAALLETEDWHEH